MLADHNHDDFSVFFISIRLKFPLVVSSVTDLGMRRWINSWLFFSVIAVPFKLFSPCLTEYARTGSYPHWTLQILDRLFSAERNYWSSWPVGHPRHCSSVSSRSNHPMNSPEEVCERLIGWRLVLLVVQGYLAQNQHNQCFRCFRWNRIFWSRPLLISYWAEENLQSFPFSTSSLHRLSTCARRTLSSLSFHCSVVHLLWMTWNGT